MGRRTVRPASISLTMYSGEGSDRSAWIVQQRRGVNVPLTSEAVDAAGFVRVEVEELVHGLTELVSAAEWEVELFAKRRMLLVFSLTGLFG